MRAPVFSGGRVVATCAKSDELEHCGETLCARRRIGSARLNVSKSSEAGVLPGATNAPIAVRLAPVGSAPWPVAHAVPQGVLTVAMVPRQSRTGGKPRPTYYVAVPSGPSAAAADDLERGARQS